MNSDRYKRADVEPRSFDHSEIRALPEYAAAAKALDGLAKAINYLDCTAETLERHDRAWWLDMIRELGAHLIYGDSSGPNHCAELHFPYRVRRNDGWCTAYYRCDHGVDGVEWSAGWTANLDALAV